VMAKLTPNVSRACTPLPPAPGMIISSAGGFLFGHIDCRDLTHVIVHDVPEAPSVQSQNAVPPDERKGSVALDCRPHLWLAQCLWRVVGLF